MTTVSVVMPAFQAERWLEQAITSVLVQTWRELELIVVDDASTDRTPDIVASFRDSRVRHLRLAHNVGVGRALNAGLAAAHGEFIARMDADDYTFADRFARQVEVLRREPSIAVLGANAQEVTAEGRTLKPRFALFHGRALHWVVNLWCPMLHPTVMMRRAALPPSGYPGVHTQMEDWALWLEMSARVRLENLPDVMLVYRRHPAAASYTPARRPPGFPIFRAHLAHHMGLEVDGTTAAAWMRASNLPEVTRPDELAAVARALAPDAVCFHADVPPWDPRELARCRRVHAKHLLAMMWHARRRPDIVRALAGEAASALALASRRVRGR